MDPVTRAAALAVAVLRPRGSVLVVLAVLVLLVAQYYCRVLFDVTDHGRLFAVPDAVLGVLVAPARWLAARVADPAAMDDLPQLALAVGYGYLLAAVVATFAEAVAAGL